MTPRRVVLIAAVAAVVFVLDRITKGLVVANVPLHTSREMLGDWLRITHTQNSGSAFGLFQERTTILSILSIVAVGAILYYYGRAALCRPRRRSMQLGGASATSSTGSVRATSSTSWMPGGERPVLAFNVADSSIVVGIFSSPACSGWRSAGLRAST